jgi:hypothetical protein
MASTNIAHSYVAPSDNEFRLAINVGIGGGPLQYYLSTLDAACNPTTWYGFGGGSTTKAPASTVPTAPAVAPGFEVTVSLAHRTVRAPRNRHILGLFLRLCVLVQLCEAGCDFRPKSSSRSAEALRRSCAC